MTTKTSRAGAALRKTARRPSPSAAAASGFCGPSPRRAATATPTSPDLQGAALRLRRPYNLRNRHPPPLRLLLRNRLHRQLPLRWSLTSRSATCARR
jgi:hypothetical protein